MPDTKYVKWRSIGPRQARVHDEVRRFAREVVELPEERRRIQAVDGAAARARIVTADMTDQIVFVGYVRSPMPAFQSTFAGVRTVSLGAAAVVAAVTHAGVLAQGSTASTYGVLTAITYLKSA